MQPKPQVNILLVDDRVENLIALESVLADLGQTLVRAHSGKEALKCVLHQEFAVILLDVQMPGIDGFETASLIRAREKTRHVPIIFLTAINKHDTHVFKGYSVGAVDYVFKPFEPDVLRAKVAAFVEMSRNVTRLQDEITHRKATEARLDSSKGLLESISRALMMFIADGDPDAALGHLLQNVLNVTDSEHGFIGEIFHTVEGKPYLKYHAVSIAPGALKLANRETALDFPVLTSLEMREMCGAIEASGGPFVAGDQAGLLSTFGPNSVERGLKSLAGLPLCSGENLVGVVGAANWTEEFSTELIASLDPICSTCATIIEGHRNARRRHQAETEIQKLNEDLECRVLDRTAELASANHRLQDEIRRHKQAKEVLKTHQARIESLNERLRRSMTETHHRVKNSLQMIAAMVDMHLMDHSHSLPASDIRQLGLHVRALAAVHDLLTEESKEGDGQAHFLSSRTLLDELLPMLQATAAGREIVFDIDDVQLTASQGTSLALVVNELVSNGLKHGRGVIQVHLQVTGDGATLLVLDDGPGFPDEFDPVTSASTGLDLIQQLIHWDLSGTARFENRAEGGASVHVTLPIRA